MTASRARCATPLDDGRRNPPLRGRRFGGIMTR
jgi:hypothetical protein